LLDRLEKIDRKLKSLTSYRDIFLKGIVTGVGTFIGATIVVGLLFGVLSQVFDFAGQIEVINEILDQTDIENIVDENTNRQE
jgi:hypothetical protein